MRRMIAASVARRIALKKMGAGALVTPSQSMASGADAAGQTDKPLAKAELTLPRLQRRSIS